MIKKNYNIYEKKYMYNKYIAQFIKSTHANINYT